MTHSTATRNGRLRRQHVRRATFVACDGFTMIELLIVVTIMLLLTTFTIISVDLTFESERVRSGARQVQSLLEGARDRAIRAREPRGVRFLLDTDQDNGRMVASMVYVGAAEPWNEGQITLKRPDFNNDDVADQPEILIVEGTPEALWDNLKRRGFLGVNEDFNGNGTLDAGEDLNGNGGLDVETPRIRIPGDKNGTWYRVRTHLLGRDPVNPNILVLTQEYRDPGTTPTNSVVAFEGTGPSTYVLELPPRILPDADQVLLPAGVVIDLDASDVPAFWRPPSGTAHRTPYLSRMDLMFSPRGTVIGSPAGAGLIHFYITRRIDVENATRLVSPPRLPVNVGSPPLVPADGFFASLPNSPPVGDRSLVSVFTSTGKVASHPLNLENILGEDANNNGVLDGDTTPGNGIFTEDTNDNGTLDVPDQFADDPFVFAELGEVSS